MTFFQVVQDELKARGWSQRVLAEKAELSRSYLSRNFLDDSHSPSIDKAMAIARAFGVSLQYLVDRMEDEQ